MRIIPYSSSSSPHTHSSKVKENQDASREEEKVILQGFDSIAWFGN
jgi:hypothetical protein